MLFTGAALVRSGPRALRDLGGSTKPREVIDLALELVEIGDDERAEHLMSGGLRVVNQACWACQHLRWAGLVDLARRGRWTLTERDWELDLAQTRNVGGAGDRGIDIEGRIRVNPVVSFRVGVQCNSY